MLLKILHLSMVIELEVTKGIKVDTVIMSIIITTLTVLAVVIVTHKEMKTILIKQK